MMATESLRGRSDEATVTSEPEPAIKIDTSVPHDGLDQAHVNGDIAGSATTDDIENKHISDIVDDLVNSTEVSISGGSDNEATKSDASKLKDGDKGHGRTSSSVKKPASFKSINVNKTFLTTKGAAPAVPTKAGDKATPATGSPSTPAGTLTARPRLVAKSGPGLVAKSSSGANGGKPGSAPDPNAVWNKNRPVPPPPPKNYTDEELKKYGIHMANRLHTDDTKGGQANWADIDDDDEDWAPDTITWQDGTKIAIPHTEEPVPTPPEPEPVPAPVHVPAPLPAPISRPAVKENGIIEKAKSPAPAASPIIKPGVLASGKGLVLKGAPEKPTLVAKPPAPPTPVKSPWAPIPKVDKASPVVIDTPNHGAAKFPPKDVPTSISSTPPPPKEIAADDFSRTTWRDGSSGTGRELYNSQSGRYEPVPDRRGSLRTEPQHGRQPALLQRSPNHEQQGLAELRPNEPPVPYGRRRGSSNVSGGSGSYMHRLKTHEQPMPPPELLSARRGSMTGRSDSPASPRNYSPSGLQGGPRHGQGWPTRASPATSHATPYQQNAQLAEARNAVPPVQPPAASAIEEELELQKRVMRERRELAMKRRLEEEAREEAERKERIRLKLEALGPAPESNSAKKAAAKDTVVTPTQIQPRETLPQATPTDEAKTPEKALSTSATAESTKTNDPMTNGVQPETLPSPVSVEARPQPQSSTHAHPWPNPAKQPDRYAAASWGTQPSVAKNVWGAPNNNRSLGNGTFNADLGATQVPQLPNKAGPGPIAPPASARAASATITTTSATAARQPPIGPPKQAAGRLSAQDRDAKQSAWASSVRLNDDAFNQMLNAQYEERDRQLQKDGRTLTDLQPVIKDTWRPTKIDETGHRNESAPKQSLHLGPDNNSWVTSSETKPGSSQRATSVGSATPSEYSQRAQSTAPARDVTSAGILGPNSAAPQPSRGSRFFPAHRDRQDTSSEAAQRPKSPSPPPPDMAGHPAFDGDVAHPHVSLPRPPVVVRLPPVAISTSPSASALEAANIPKGPSSMSQGPSFAWASQAAYKEEGSPTASGPSHQAKSSDWQEKFNNLLSGRKTHPGPRSPAADHATQATRDLPAHPASSSPPAALASGRDGSVTTKVRDEECFEEQEMGSLPPVKLPNAVQYNEWVPSPAPKPLPKRFLAAVASAESISFPVDMSGTGTVWRVAFPGFVKNITVPFGRSRSNPRRGGGSRGGGRQPPTAPHPRGTGKGREGAPAYSNDQGSSATGPNPPVNRNRGGFRGGREGWSRPSPIHT